MATTDEPRPPAPLGPPPSPAPARRATLVVATLALFLVWSNTFLAFEVLLAPKSGAAPMTWLDLVVARFTPVVLVGAVVCFGFRRREAMAVLRAHPRRLVLCGLLAVPTYNGILYFCMQHRVSGPVASLLTTLSPLYLVVLGALALHERIRPRQIAGLGLGLLGVVLVATAKQGTAASGWHVALLALAPLSWSCYSALTKPVARTVSPLLWSYLVLTIGGAPLLLLLPWHGGPAMAALDAKGWALVLYLALVATIFGNAVWGWLLRHLPASTTGFTIFLNPPLTAGSKLVLSALFPAAFTFAVSRQEWIGGAFALAGVALAVFRPRVSPVPVDAPDAAGRVNCPPCGLPLRRPQQLLRDEREPRDDGGRDSIGAARDADARGGVDLDGPARRIDEPYLGDARLEQVRELRGPIEPRGAAGEHLDGEQGDADVVPRRVGDAGEHDHVGLEDVPVVEADVDRRGHRAVADEQGEGAVDASEDPLVAVGRGRLLDQAAVDELGGEPFGKELVVRAREAGGGGDHVHTYTSRGAACRSRDLAGVPPPGHFPSALGAASPTRRKRPPPMEARPWSSESSTSPIATQWISAWRNRFIRRTSSVR